MNTTDNFTDYYQIEVRLRFTKRCLGANFDPEDRMYTFERDPEGNLQLSAMYWRAMFRNILKASTSSRIKTLPPALANHIYPDMMRINQVCTATEITGHQVHEALEIGSTLYARFLVPGSHVSPEVFKELMGQAGQWIGFSPAKSALGYGRFLIQETKIIVEE